MSTNHKVLLLLLIHHLLTECKINTIDKKVGMLLGQVKLFIYHGKGLTLCKRAIQGNIMFEIDGISLTERRDDSEVENRIFPSIARPKELQ